MPLSYEDEANTELVFHTKSNTFSLELDTESAEDLLSLLEDCSIHSDTKMIVGDVGNEFIESEVFGVLKENGLLVL